MVLVYINRFNEVGNTHPDSVCGLTITPLSTLAHSHRNTKSDHEACYGVL